MTSTREAEVTGLSEDYTNRTTYEGDIVIPSSVKYNNLNYTVTGIGDYAFYYCTALVSVTCLNPEPPTCKTDVFGYVNTFGCTLIVPAGSYDDYAAADTWKDFLIQEDLTKIDLPVAGNAEEAVRYTLDGIQTFTPRKGLNVIRYSDGSVKKVVVK